MSHYIPIVGLIVCVACVADPAGETKGSSPMTTVASVVLDLGDVGGTGVMVAPYMLTVPAGTDCVSSMELVDSNWGGVMLPTITFLALEPGVGSIMAPSQKFYWSRSDPDAQGSAEMTDSWSGTWMIREWSSAMHVFDLVDGVHCVEPETETGCAPEEGVVTIDGVVDENDVVHTGPVTPWWVDLATGDSLCSSGW